MYISKISDLGLGETFRFKGAVFVKTAERVAICILETPSPYGFCVGQSVAFTEDIDVTVTVVEDVYAED